MNHKKVIGLTCVAALMWSLAGLNIKMISWTPYAIAGGRSLIAMLLLTPVVLKSKKRRIDWYVLGGALCYAAFNYCFVASTKLTTSANAIMLQYTAPIYVALLLWVFLKERVTRTDIYSMACVFAGMVLFFMDQAGGGSTIGNAVAVFNGVTFAGISIFLRLLKNGNPVMSMYLGNIIAGVAGISFIVRAGRLDRSDFFFLILLGSMVALSYVICAKASTGLSELETVIIPIIDPIMNPVWVFLTLGEKPGRLSLLAQRSYSMGLHSG
ncbi:hypothetical protein OBV_03230 [Oscillibacter valericigenes Sjm18-20]|nr:hypothetical protein OBV_03230 [Oscillibacter valericigenes Sjm18-20]